MNLCQLCIYIFGQARPLASIGGCCSASCAPDSHRRVSGEFYKLTDGPNRCLAAGRRRRPNESRLVTLSRSEEFQAKNSAVFLMCQNLAKRTAKKQTPRVWKFLKRAEKTKNRETSRRAAAQTVRLITSVSTPKPFILCFLSFCLPAGRDAQRHAGYSDVTPRGMLGMVVSLAVLAGL